jgi:hypothetical protein
MKIKVGTVLDDKILYRAKRTALEEKKSISRLLEDALESYLREREKGSSGKGGRNIARSTQGIMKVSQKTLKAVMEEEGFYES